MSKETPFEGSFKDTRSTRWLRRMMKWAVGFFAKRTPYYVTVHERPKFADDVETWPDVTDQSSVAIVMQGPIWEGDEFTVETFRLYKRNFPGALLILSTWKDTDPAHLEPIRKLGVDVVLSEKPEDPGNFNINMQLTSALAGVRRAREAGVEWVMKTRTDQRLYNPNALSYLIATAKAFPVMVSSSQKYRVIGVGHGTLKYAPYHMTDQTLFGHVDDMLMYWSAPMLPSKEAKFGQKSAAELYLSYSVRDLCRWCSPEAYLGSQFLMRVGRRLEWTIEDHWAALRDHYCVADYAATDFFWVKVQPNTLRELTTRYYSNSNRKEVDFAEWLNFYAGQTPLPLARTLEASLDEKFMRPIPKREEFEVVY